VNELLGIEQTQFPEPWTKNMLLDEIGNTETRRYTVAVLGGTIVGYLGVMFVMDELHVNTIGTLPGFEGRGVATLVDGRRVARCARAWSGARDARGGDVETNAPNACTSATALNLWGFERTTTSAPERTLSCCGRT